MPLPLCFQSASRGAARRRRPNWRALVGAVLLGASVGVGAATDLRLDNANDNDNDRTSATDHATDCPPAPIDSAPALQIDSALGAPDRGFLWRIRKDGRDAYLYGTVHIGKAAWRTPGPRVAQALAASDTLALELDPLDPDVLRRLQLGVAARPERTLPAALAQRIERLARAECLAPLALSGVIPEIQIAALLGLQARRDGLYSTFGVDTLLARWGHAKRVMVVSLETPELQLRAMQNLPPPPEPTSPTSPTAPAAPTAAAGPELHRSIAHALDAIETGRARPLLARIAQIWENGDLAGLQNYAAWCECMDSAPQRAETRRSLDARNPALADAIAALHARGQHVFAAVGSLHLIGSLGLPALLAQRGFQIERLSADAP